MVFEKLIIKNYRQYKDIEFDFNEDINIIEAENGIGKSTFMSTIIFALYGIEAVRRSGLIEDMTYMANQDNVEVNISRTSYNFLENLTDVTLILRINGSNKVYEINRTLDNRRYMAECKVKDVGMLNAENFEKTNTYEITETEKIDTSLSKVISVIPENIAPLLFFDGERINSIESVINVGRKSDEFQREIEKILNIESFEEANSLIRKAIRDVQVKLTSDATDTELAKMQRECNDLEQEIKVMAVEKERLIDKLSDQEIETKEYKEILKQNEKSIKLQKQRESLEAQIQEAQKLEEVYKSELLAMIWKDGPKLSTSSIFGELNEVLSTGKSIYEISGMEQRAIDDILVKSKCICGTRLTTAMREELAELKETLPPESFESMLKSEVADSVDLDDLDKENVNLRIDYGQVLSKINKLKVDVEKISTQMQEIDEDNIFATESKLEKSLEFEQKFQNEISSLEGQIKSHSNILATKQVFIDEKLKLEKTNELDKQVRKVLEESEKYLKLQIATKKENIKSVLENRVNQNIQRLMRDSVHITLKKNLTPEVHFTAGATSASSGQNVMISLAYLLGLMQIAKIQTGDEIISKQTSYPIVMDGVTAKLDNSHTRSMVKNILSAQTQVIFLANDQMFVELENSIKEIAGCSSIEDKVVRLKRDKDTNTTYKVGE